MDIKYDSLSPRSLSSSPLLLDMAGYDSDSDTSNSGFIHTVEEEGVGLANPALSHSRRRLLDLINRLHSTGSVVFIVTLTFASLINAPRFLSDQVDIDLHQIAVIGSQSAGKFSIIE